MLKKRFLQCGLDYLVTNQRWFPSSWRGQDHPGLGWNAGLDVAAGSMLIVVTWCCSEENIQLDALESRAAGERVKAAVGSLDSGVEFGSQS